MLYGLFIHTLSVILFSHRGQGIPRAYSALHALVLGIAIAAALLRWTALAGVAPQTPLFSLIASNFIIAAFWGPTGLMFALLASIGVDLSVSAATLAGLDTATTLVAQIASLWEVSSFVLAYQRSRTVSIKDKTD